ncbi:hypothetical protein TgHK011_004040 [Trichoderma gracile]|nr:hypothetical protein TgHK011_004040 [Trichoderma gracile]
MTASPSPAADAGWNSTRGCWPCPAGDACVVRDSRITHPRFTHPKPAPDRTRIYTRILACAHSFFSSYFSHVLPLSPSRPPVCQLPHHLPSPAFSRWPASPSSASLGTCSFVPSQPDEGGPAALHLCSLKKLGASGSSLRREPLLRSTRSLHAHPPSRPVFRPHPATADWYQRTRSPAASTEYLYMTLAAPCGHMAQHSVPCPLSPASLPFCPLPTLDGALCLLRRSTTPRYYCALPWARNPRRRIGLDLALAGDAARLDTLAEPDQSRPSVETSRCRIASALSLLLFLFFTTASPPFRIPLSQLGLASQCPTTALDALSDLESIRQPTIHDAQGALTPPAACRLLTTRSRHRFQPPAYDAAGRDSRLLDASVYPSGARPGRRHKPASLSTQAAVSTQVNHIAPAGSTGPDDVAHKMEAPEEEPYTIKCICNFSDDDGNTIYCETCDTWQHIDCFYPENREEAIREDFAHSCADCKPRPLNRQKAIERTLRLRSSIVEPENIDKKAKRPPSKSHKKKPKPSDFPLNGNHGAAEGGKHGHSGDHHHHPSKKSKTSHRPSLSVSSQPSKRSPSYGNHRANPTHPPSPATTPPDLPDDFQIHHYSEGFCSMYNDVPDTRTNKFVSLAIPGALIRWVESSSALEKEVGRTPSEVFQEAVPALERKRPKLEIKDATQSLDNGTTLRWRSLKSTSPIEKDVPLIELNGEIGFQKDYCADSDNLWADLSSPLPFVFFHPILPLYIDTRKEGSLARDRAIPPSEQITLPWDFRLEKSVCQRWLHLLGLSDDDGAAQDEFELDESEYTAISNWIDRILSEYGGCACDLDNNCAFARFHRHYLYGKSQSRGNKKRPRKTKAHTISPSSTGHATNSRAASEGHIDERSEDRAKRDESVPARSKPSSRDRTPLRQGSFDQLGILTEPTDRDKRKVAMVEDSFRRMEQEQQQPPRKKKRVSDGTTTSTSSKSKSRTGSTPHIGSYADASTTSRSKSGSPAGSISPNLGNQPKPAASHRASADVQSPPRQSSAPPRSAYRDMGIQTDPVDDEWFSQPSALPCRKKRIISLSQRLLNNRFKARAEVDHKRISVSTSSRPSPADAMDVDAAEVDEKPDLPKAEAEVPQPASSSPAPPPPEQDEDKRAPDALPAPSSSEAPVPSSETPSSTLERPKGLELRVQLPTIPALDSTAASTPSTTATMPLSAGSSTVQSAFISSISSAANGVVATPSPIKKKLSLSDYTKSRMNKAAVKPSLGLITTKPSPAEVDEIKVENASESATTEKAESAVTLSTNGHP